MADRDRPRLSKPDHQEAIMNKFLSGLMATALVGTFAVASVMPANAAPVYVPKSEQMRTDVEKVNHYATPLENRTGTPAHFAPSAAPTVGSGVANGATTPTITAPTAITIVAIGDHNNGYWRDNDDRRRPT